MSSVKWTIMKDEAELSTLLLIGAGLQSLLVLFLPAYVAILPACLLLFYRAASTYLMTLGLIHNPRLDGVVKGKLWASYPDPNGDSIEKAPKNSVVLFILGARSNHPLGRSSPEFKEMTVYFQAMWREADENRELYGYLGRTFPLIGAEQASGNVLLTLSYWKSIEHLHAFARGPTHRAGWDWMNKMVNKNPNLGIMHETYLAPYGNWENVYANFRPFGFAQTKHLVRDIEDESGESPKLPMPPYDPILGHLIFCYKIASKLPSNAYPNYLPDMIRRGLPDLGPVYYLDTWPFGQQMLVVASLGPLHQITQEHLLPKYHAMKSFLQPITEGLDIVTMEGQTWKTWRGIFNPGFSPSHLVTLTSAIVEETATFCDRLQGYLDAQKVFRMKDLTDFLALDVIGRVVLDPRLDSQMHSNPLVDGLRMQIRWLTSGADVNPIKRFNSLRPIIHRYNAWRMNSYVSKELDSRMANFRPDNRSSSVVDLALSAYLSESSDKELLGGMNSIFRQYAMS
ncbi:hypothetical protein MMC15_001397 [Xylographa vitiligo]|nr:hypothetical protein [Xylographa vitiligo]